MPTRGVVDVSATLDNDPASIGGKASSLVVMLSLGLPVPPAFVLTTDVCREFLGHGFLPANVRERVGAALHRLERATGLQFGDPNDPMLVSVRSGAPVSMPGMMDTVLNVGLNDATVKGLTTATSEDFARQCHARWLRTYGAVVGGSGDVEGEDPDEIRDGLRMLGIEVPDDPGTQLLRTIEAVFRSWNSDRAHFYRQRLGIPEELGTAVIVQSMVFGNRGPASGTGVLFSRDPNTGEPVLYGDYLAGAQGEDVVSGGRATLPIAALESSMPEIARQLTDAASRLEHYVRNMVDIEFTVECGRLYLLQFRVGKRAAPAAVRIAVDMVNEGLIDKVEAVARISEKQRRYALQPTVATEEAPVTCGLGACPGVATGAACFSPDRADSMAEAGPVVLVRRETSPDDVHGMVAAAGVLTGLGGLVSHAALVARELQLPAVVGATAIKIDAESATARIGSTVINEGDLITVDGTTGEVFLGRQPVIEAVDNIHFDQIKAWSTD